MWWEGEDNPSLLKAGVRPCRAQKQNSGTAPMWGAAACSLFSLEMKELGGRQRGQKGWRNELSDVVAGGPPRKQQVLGLKQKQGCFTRCIYLCNYLQWNFEMNPHEIWVMELWNATWLSSEEGSAVTLWRIRLLVQRMGTKSSWGSTRDQ